MILSILSLFILLSIFLTFRFDSKLFSIITLVLTTSFPIIGIIYNPIIYFSLVSIVPLILLLTKSKRKTFWLSNSSSGNISFESNLKLCFPSFCILYNNEPNLTIRFWFLFDFYISINHKILWKLYNINKNSKYAKALGDYPDTTRRMGWSFHHWNFWLYFWQTNMSWQSKDKRSFIFNFKDLLWGKHEVDFKLLNIGYETLYFPEDSYDIVFFKEERLDRYSRPYIKDKKMLSYEIVVVEKLTDKQKEFICNYKIFNSEFIKSSEYYNQKNDFIEKHFIQSCIPIPGKGTMSYNCDEDCSYSVSGPLNKTVIETIYDHYKYIMKKRGGSNWKPEKYRNNENI